MNLTPQKRNFRTKAQGRRRGASPPSLEVGHETVLNAGNRVQLLRDFFTPGPNDIPAEGYILDQPWHGDHRVPNLLIFLLVIDEYNRIKDVKVNKLVLSSDAFCAGSKGAPPDTYQVTVKKTLRLC